MGRTRTDKAPAPTKGSRASARSRQPTRFYAPPLESSSSSSKTRKAKSTSSRKKSLSLSDRDLAAQVVGAVLTLSVRRKAQKSGVAHNSIKKHIDEHSTAERTQVQEQRFRKKLLGVKHELMDFGVLVAGLSTGNKLAISDEASEELKELKERKSANSDDDEEAARQYLAQAPPPKSSSSKSSSRRSKKRSKASSDSDDAPSPAISSGKSKKPKKAAPLAPKKSSSRKRTVKFVVPPEADEQTGDEADEEGVDQLASSDEEHAPTPKKRAKASGAGSRGGLTRMKRDDLIEEVRTLRTKVDKMEGHKRVKGNGKASALEQEEEEEAADAEPGEEDEEDLAVASADLVKKFAHDSQHWEAKARLLKKRLSRHEPVSDMESGVEEDEQGRSDKAVNAGSENGNDLGGMDQQFFDDFVEQPHGDYDRNRNGRPVVAYLAEQENPNATFSIEGPIRGGASSLDAAQPSGEGRTGGFHSPDFPELDVNEEMSGAAAPGPSQLREHAPLSLSGSRLEGNSAISHASGLPSPARSWSHDDTSSPLARTTTSGPANKGKERESTPFLSPVPAYSSSPTKSQQGQEISSRLPTTEPSSPSQPGFSLRPSQAAETQMKLWREGVVEKDREIEDLKAKLEQRGHMEAITKEELDYVGHRYHDLQGLASETAVDLDYSHRQIIWCQAANIGAQKLNEGSVSTEKKLHDLEERLAIAETEREKAVVAATSARSELTAVREDLDARTQELVALQRVEQEITRQREYAAKQSEDARLQKEEERRHREKAEKALEDERKQAQADQRTIAILTSDIAELNAQIDSIGLLRSRAAEEHEAAVKRSSEDLAETKRQLDVATTTLEALEKTEQALRSQLNTSDASVTSLKMENHEVKKEYKAVSEGLPELTSEYRILSTRVIALGEAFSIPSETSDHPSSASSLSSTIDTVSDLLRTHIDEVSQRSADLAAKDGLLKSAAAIAQQILALLPGADDAESLAEEEQDDPAVLLTRIQDRVEVIKLAKDTATKDVVMASAVAKAAQDMVMRLKSILLDLSELSGTSEEADKELEPNFVVEKMKALIAGKDAELKKVKEERKRLTEVNEEERAEKEKELAKRDDVINDLRAATVDLTAQLNAKSGKLRRLSELSHQIAEEAEDAMEEKSSKEVTPLAGHDAQ
ncbi:hypothetical protein JCM11641_004491 [Rhodosporidiobolus odoratus]